MQSKKAAQREAAFAAAKEARDSSYTVPREFAAAFPLPGDAPAASALGRPPYHPSPDRLAHQHSMVSAATAVAGKRALESDLRRPLAAGSYEPLSKQRHSLPPAPVARESREPSPAAASLKNAPRGAAASREAASYHTAVQQREVASYHPKDAVNLGKFFSK